MSGADGFARELARFGQATMAPDAIALLAMPKGPRRPPMMIVRKALCAGQVKGLPPCPFHRPSLAEPCAAQWRLVGCCKSAGEAYHRALLLGGGPIESDPPCRWQTEAVSGDDLKAAGLWSETVAAVYAE